jgi:hypothetical protein
MSRRRKKTNRILGPLVLLSVAAACAVGLALYVQMTPQARKAPEASAASKPAEPSGGVPVLVPEPSFEGDRLRFESGSYTVKDGTDPKVAALNAFLQRAKLFDGKVRAERVDQEDGIASLHFSEGFDSGTGSMDEATLIYGIRATMGQFEDVQSFRIFSGTKQIESLGHFEVGDLLTPIPPSRWATPYEADEEAPTGSPPPSTQG